jgi:antitoxin component YwqK of YwqJK toxin-antitoxin module
MRLLFTGTKLTGILLCAGILMGSTSAQDTLWNQVDEQGRKQGFWKKEYPNGNRIYTGYFKDDKPAGKMLRYYDDGKLKAEMVFTGREGITYATLYFKNGQAGARGKYVMQQRDSTWSYYSYYTGTLSLHENYCMGRKCGPTRKYYPEGSLAEVIQWDNDLRQGKWQQYYEDSGLRLSAWYENGELEGPYRIFNRNSILVIEGTYKSGAMDGSWKFYDSDGTLEHELEYKNGIIQNREELDRWAREYMEQVDKDLGKIPEPDFDNFFDRIP